MAESASQVASGVFEVMTFLGSFQGAFRRGSPARAVIDQVPAASLLSLAPKGRWRLFYISIYISGVKSSQVANPRNAFCIEQRTAAKPKEAQVRVFGLFQLFPRLAPVGLIAR